MGSMEQNFDGGVNEMRQHARNMAQIELAHKSGKDLLSWIHEYAGEFDRLTKNDPSLLDELARRDTHDEAIEKVTKEIYH